MRKSLLKILFKKRKKKLKVDLKSSPKKFRLFIKFKSKIKSLFKKKFKLDKFNEIKKFCMMVTGYGLMIAYIVFFIKSKHFILSAFAWGFLFYFIKEEFVEWFRRLIAKR